MKKTLLIAAAALAASVISSQAQVYSQNIVGYVNLPLGHGADFRFLVNPLTNTSASAEVVLTNVLDAGDQVQLWQSGSSSFNTYVYEGGGDGFLSEPNDWLDQNNNQVPAPNLTPGEGFFYTAGSGDNETNTFVGTVLLTNSIALGHGSTFVMVGSTPPIAADCSTNSTSLGLPIDAGDQVQLWVPAANAFNTYVYEGGPDGFLAYPNDWLDQNNNQVPAPTASVGQGLFYTAGSGDAETWNQTFTVQ